MFTADECDKIVHELGTASLEPGLVGSSSHVEAYEVDLARRNCFTSYHVRSEKNVWIYDRMDLGFRTAADEYGLDVEAVEEDLKFIVYPTGSHFSCWHMDAGKGRAQRRKLSMSVELSERNSFSGGHLEFPTTIGESLQTDKGDAVIFPSCAYHRATTVETGLRRVLVNWISGPPIR